MLTGITPEEVAGWTLLFLLGLVVACAYRADRALVTECADPSDRSVTQAWATLAGMLLIGVFCWLLMRAIFGPGSLANGSAVFLFVVIGANLADDFKHAD
jgi:hypothetical protein